jgi:hypothetical protein
MIGDPCLMFVVIGDADSDDDYREVTDPKYIKYIGKYS